MISLDSCRCLFLKTPYGLWNQETPSVRVPILKHVGQDWLPGPYWGDPLSYTTVYTPYAQPCLLSNFPRLGGFPTHPSFRDVDLRLGSCSHVQSEPGTCASVLGWRVDGWRLLQPGTRSLTLVHWSLARAQGCFTHLAQALLSSELAAGLASHLEKFKTVCLGERGPGRGDSKAWHHLSQDRLPLGREKGWAGLGWARWDSQELIYILEGRRGKGRQEGWCQGGVPVVPWHGSLRGEPFNSVSKCSHHFTPTVNSYLRGRWLRGS